MKEEEKKKRYTLIVKDNQTGGEYIFEGDHFDNKQSRGLIFIYRGDRCDEIKPNGMYQATFRLWSGCEKFEDFLKEEEVYE